MKAKKYNYGGKMEGGQMIMAMAPSLEEAVAQVQAAVKAGMPWDIECITESNESCTFP